MTIRTGPRPCQFSGLPPACVLGGPRQFSGGGPTTTRSSSACGGVSRLSMYVLFAAREKLWMAPAGAWRKSPGVSSPLA